METVVRRIGNSLGVLIPKQVLRQWGVAQGDALEIDSHGIRPPRSKNAQVRLDELKRELSILILSRFDPAEIREHSLDNLQRWKSNGVWGSAYAEWEELLRSEETETLVRAMVGRDENSNRLRQSPPFVGMLPQSEVKALYEKAAA